jgi:hypothetical protein
MCVHVWWVEGAQRTADRHVGFEAINQQPYNTVSFIASNVCVPCPRPFSRKLKQRFRCLDRRAVTHHVV